MKTDKSKTKPAPAARPPIVRIDPTTVERLTEYHDALKRMQNCRGFKQIKLVVSRARELSELIADTMQNYGPDTGSATDVFLRDFHMETGTSEYVWNAMLALTVDLEQKSSVPASVIPGV